MPTPTSNPNPLRPYLLPPTSYLYLRALRQRPHRRSIRDRAAWLDVHVEHNCLVARGADLNSMRADLEICLLQRAVEIIHSAHEVAVHVHLGITLRQIDPKAAVRVPRVATVPVAVGCKAVRVAIRRIAVGRVCQIAISGISVAIERTAVGVRTEVPGSAIEEPEVHGWPVGSIVVSVDIRAVRGDHDGWPRRTHRTARHCAPAVLRGCGGYRNCRERGHEPNRCDEFRGSHEENLQNQL